MQFGGTEAHSIPTLSAVAAPGHSGGKRNEEEAQGPEVDRVLSAVEAGWFRGAAARANYLAQDRFDLAFAAKELCRRMAVPRQSDLVALRRLARYVLEVPRLVQCFRWQAPTREFVVYTDTDFAGCPRTRRSTNGGAIMRGCHLVKHYSKTQKVVTLSSAEAELGGIVHGATEGLGVQSVAADLGIPGALTLRADAQAAIGICRRSGIGRVRHLAVGQLWIQERIREKAIRLEKVAGEANPADAATKHLCADRLRKCYEAVGCEARSGRSGAAPALAADVEPFLQEASAGRRRTQPGASGEAGSGSPTGPKLTALRGPAAAAPATARRAAAAPATAAPATARPDALRPSQLAPCQAASPGPRRHMLPGPPSAGACPLPRTRLATRTRP